MALEFTWCAQVGTSGRTDLRAVEVQFGDGYSQATQDGINGKVSAWTVQVTARGDELSDIKQFLDAHEGWVSFRWTPPGTDAVEGYYRCKGYDESPLGRGVSTITAEFKQVFQP